VTTNSLVIAGMERIALFKGSEERLLLGWSRFLGKGDISSISSEVGAKCTSLANCVGPRLIAMDDSRVLLGILVTTLVLSALIGVLRVANSVQVCKRLGLHTSGKPGRTFGHGPLIWALGNILELRLANLFVRASDKGFGL
jgi:hypothetical protein